MALTKKKVFFVVVVIVLVYTCALLCYTSISHSNKGRTLVKDAGPPHPYLVAVQYAEQLASATRNAFQLVNLTVHWNRKPVEPFVVGSFYAGVPPEANLKGLLRFSAIYNLSSVTAQMEKCFSRNISLYSFEDFLVNATRNFLLLTLNVSSDQTGHIADCTNNQSTALRTTEKRLNAHLKRVNSSAMAVHGRKYEFNGTRAVCVEASKLSIEDVTYELLSESNKHLSVVVVEWRGIWNNSMAIPGQFYYYNPDYSWEFADRCHLYSLPRTQWITDAANEFRNSLNLSGNVIGVHLRIEKLAMDDAKQHGHLDSCLNKTHAVAQALLKTYNLTFSTSNVVVVHDRGKYGSQGCEIEPLSVCDEARDRVLQKLNSWGLEVMAYDPASFKKPHHSGFVSIIEKEFLAGTEHLIVVGGGGYQTSARTLFAEKHNNSEPIYRVCQRFTPDHLHGLQIQVN